MAAIISAKMTPPVPDAERNPVVKTASSRAPIVNINPTTGLATDYLNHFNEAIMLLEMVGSCPECMADFLSWRPKSYHDHFAASRLSDRHAAIAAYEGADPDARRCLEVLAGTMTEVLQITRAAMHADLPPEAVHTLAERAAKWLKPLVARAGAVINGEAAPDSADAATPQAAVDLLMRS